MDEENKQNEPHRPMTERELQQELENQIRGFGATISDGIRYGFEGRGGELGSRAKDIGFTLMDAINQGISESKKAKQAGTGAPAGSGGYRYTYSPNASFSQGERQRFAGQAARAAARRATRSSLNRDANIRLGVGLGQTIAGGVMAFGLLLGGVICLGIGGAGLPELAAADVQVLGVVGASLTAAGLPFAWLTIAGCGNLGASGFLKRCARVIGTENEVSLAVLAQGVGKSLSFTRRRLRKLIAKGRLTAWLDDDTDMLYLTAQSFRDAQEKKQSAAAAQQPAPETEEKVESTSAGGTEFNREMVESFIRVLGSEQQMMEDPLAVEELEQMQKTSREIVDWLVAHPESAPRARRFVTYYVPTTLKLLHTYNDVKGQQGDNAESIRRDIAGILHTLNLAYKNLLDSLLSDVAMDISGEIAALQGILASDGLCDDGLLKPKK